MIWAIIPTYDPCLPGRRNAMSQWKNMGYRLIGHAQTPQAAKELERLGFNIVMERPWEGLFVSYNMMIQKVLYHNPNVDAIVQASDDIYPDHIHRPSEIEAQFLERFPDTMGVMQPRGDDYGNLNCAQSPWLGRAFIEHFNGKSFCEEYEHYFADEELQAVAMAMGCFWDNRAITQYHDHWTRNKQGRPVHLPSEMLVRDRETFRRRMQQG